MVSRKVTIGVVIGLTCLILLGVLITGCLKPEEEAPKRELTIGVKGWAGPSDIISAMGGSADHLVFETLVMMDQNKDFKPLLAESWDISEDGETYTFYLRKNVKFHDGTQLTANDVEFSIDHFKYPPLISVIDDIQVTDDRTVKFILKRPFPQFLFELHFGGAIIKPTEYEDGVVTNAVGTGPFKLGDHAKDQYFTIIKNENYWGGNVKLDKVTFKVIPDPHTRVMALETGEIDMTGTDAGSHIPTAAIPGLKNIPNLELMKSEKTGFRINVVAFNCLKSPFNDLRVRKAVCYAIDKNAINIILGESGRVIDGAVFPETEWYNPANKGHPYDLDKAKELLAEAGWEDTDGDGILEKDGNPFKVSFVISPVSPLWSNIAEVIQAQLKEVGIDVKIQVLETGAHFAALSKGNFDMTIKVDTGTPRIPPDFSHTYHSTSRAGGWGAKIIENETLDRLINQYLSTLDHGKQLELAYEIQEVINEKRPVALYIEDYRIIAMNKKVQSFEPMPGRSSLRYLWKAHLGGE
jgi:peptide/nickel transport system substrate-binding protein